ncbi:MAG: serine/threonine protein kinase [Thermoanaerobaculia bacterium]|nr:serine/threonine protein kinase [Thermoanaerobaculia bacterium]
MSDPTDDSSRHPTLAGSDTDGYSNFFLEMSAGLLLGGRYVVTRFLGQGAMGVVVAARDEDLGTHIAAKVLRPSLASSREAQNRFRSEVRIAQRITHANVCRIYDLGRHHDKKSGLDLPFFTMELLEGPTLARYLDEEGSLELDEAYDLLRGIVAGLAAAHQAGIVHRDLKSSNVMIVAGDSERRPVVTDFGLSFSVTRGSRSPITHQGQVLGTPAFISP